MPEFTDSLNAMVTAAAALPRDSATFAGLGEQELLAIPALIADIFRMLEPSAAAAAGEIGRRSTRDHGFDGLAQRTGYRTPEGLVQHLTGSTSREAAKLVRTGVIIHEAEVLTRAEATGEVPPELTKPWLAVVGRAVARGMLSLEAADAIRLGLGVPNEEVAADALAEAASNLVEAAATLNVDQLLIRARSIRDDLDEAGIADREKLRQRARSLRRYRRTDGMTAYTLIAEPESAAYLDGIYDSLTSPRRGGPRMVDLEAKGRAEAIETDPRTLEQLAFDGFMAIIRIGATTDEKTAARNVLGSRRPAVRVLVTQRALASRTGHGRIEGFDTPIAIETVERIVCGTGTVPVAFDDDRQCVNLGREQRLFTARQRIGLAARDGGCRWPGCDRPPSWTEAHHIKQWARDHGSTDLADGVLLCRYHHLLLHDNHWDITRIGGEYSLVPPKSEDPSRTPRPMPHKSAALGDLQKERAEQKQPAETHAKPTQSLKTHSRQMHASKTNDLESHAMQTHANQTRSVRSHNMQARAQT